MKKSKISKFAHICCFLLLMLFIISCDKDDESPQSIKFEIDCDNSSIGGSFVQNAALTSLNTFNLRYSGGGSAATANAKEVNGVYISEKQITLEENGSVQISIEGMPIDLGEFTLKVEITINGKTFYCSQIFEVAEDTDPTAPITFTMDSKYNTISGLVDAVSIPFTVNPSLSGIVVDSPVTGLNVKTVIDKKTGEGILTLTPGDDFIGGDLGLVVSFGARKPVPLTISASPFVNGNGSVSSPYEINSVELLKKMQYLSDKHFKLIENLNLENTTWEPLGTEASKFAGSLDGNGKTISNINITGTTNIALFGYTAASAQISNLTVSGSVVGTEYVAGLVANNAYVDIVSVKLMPDGTKFFIRGINLGNWLNPEGYMLLFKDANSYRLINDAFCEMVGPDFTNRFWQEYLKNYITHEDIKYIKQTGMNSIRLPFHYKLFTDDNYMGKNKGQSGFEIFDRLLGWCRHEGLYVILDMHVAPGGQTGDNIDDSYGYPWLFESEDSKRLFCDIWKQIATRYANDPVILGYDLVNEPIAHYFRADYDKLNTALEPLYKRCVDSIRTVDKNHIVLLGGAQWNSNFKVFTDSKFDDNIMYTCHRYKCDTLKSNIQDIIRFRDSVDLPMYMGETGENTDEWVGGFRRLLEDNNIGWHFWPYKKMATRACMAIIPTPQNWNVIVDYTEADRSSYAKVREARPNQEVVRNAMLEFLENMKFANCVRNKGYTEALGMKP